MFNFFKKKEKKEFVKVVFYLNEDEINVGFEDCGDAQSLLLLINEVCSDNLKKDVYTNVLNYYNKQGKKDEALITEEFLCDDNPVVRPTQY